VFFTNFPCSLRIICERPVIRESTKNRPKNWKRGKASSQFDQQHNTHVKSNTLTVTKDIETNNIYTLCISSCCIHSIKWSLSHDGSAICTKTPMSANTCRRQPHNSKQLMSNPRSNRTYSQHQDQASNRKASRNRVCFQMRLSVILNNFNVC